MINIDHIVNVSISIVSVLFATFLGYWISNVQNKRKGKKRDTLVIFKAINLYLNDINDIAMKLMSVDRIFSIILKENEYIKINLDEMDYFEIVSIISKQKIFINSKKEKSMKLITTLYSNIDSLTDFELFIKIGKRLDYNAMESILFINHDIKEIYDKIILDLSKYTMNNMKGLYIFKYKDQLITALENLKVEIKKMK